MPSEAVKKALERIRREKQQNSETPQFINAYNLDAQNETIDKFANSPLFTQEPLQPRPQTSDAVGLLKSAGKSLYTGVYGFAESGLLGLPSLAEAAIDRYTGVDIGAEDLAEQFREESSVAQVVGGIGTGAGYLAGLPVKGSLKLAQKIGIPSAIIRGFSKQSLSRADKITKGIAKKGGLDKKVVNDFSQKLKGETRKFISKGDRTDDLFNASFSKNINDYIAKGMSSGRLTKDQASVIHNMKKAVTEKGIPIGTLQDLSRVKYGADSFMGRLVPELLLDASVFVVADGVIDAISQGKEALKGEREDYDWERTFTQMGYGFVAGTTINLATAPFKPLAKMSLSRKDFADGVRGYLGMNTYKGKDLTYLSKQLSYIADHNKANGKSTRLSKDGKYINFAKEGNKELGYKNIEREMRREFGENAEDEAIKWLMKYRREYSKDVIRESGKEAWQNYKNIWVKMAVGGGAMSLTGAVQTHIQGGELVAEDLISSFIIGSFTQRRGAGKLDINSRMQKLRDGLEEFGINVQNTSFANSFSRGNERFGVGIVRDNPELTSYLKEQRLVSDDDITITNDTLSPDEQTFLDLETIPDRAIDPYEGRMEAIYQLLGEDFKYVREAGQISKAQADEIINILDRQGFKTVEDINKAFEDRVVESTKSMEQSITNVLENINGANLDDFTINSSNRGFIVGKDFKASEELLKKARNGDFKEWLNGKEGQEAEQELLDMFDSLEMVAEVAKGLGNAKTHKESVNTIVSEKSLETVYNIVRDAEKNIDDSSKNYDGRKQFTFTDVESYIIPMIKNKGNNTTKRIMDIFDPNKTDDKLESLLNDVGILHNKKIIDDYSKIQSTDEAKALELGKIHGIIRAMGKYEITDTASGNTKIESDRIESLKYHLDGLGFNVDTFNRPNLQFMYQMVVADINRTRLNNSLINDADVDFVIQQSGSEIFSKPGLITDKGIRGFQLTKLYIPSDPKLESKYNQKLKDLNEESGGLIQVVDAPIMIKPDTALLLRDRMDSIYSGENKLEQNVKLTELFDVMRNTSLDNVRNQMKEYLLNYDKEAQASIMSMLKRQGIIKRNTDGSLNLEINDTNLLDFEEGLRDIGKFIDKKGFTDSFVENQILKRKEEALDRLYVSDASDVVKNPSLGLDGFYKRYDFKITNKETGKERIEDLSKYDSRNKVDHFDDLIFDKDDNGKLQITQTSIQRMANSIVSKGTEFKDLNREQKSKVIQDINQVVFGKKDKVSVQKISYVDGNVIFEDQKQIIQNNPVHQYLNSIGIEYSFFDNNVLIKENDQSGVMVERKYNLLQTEDIPDNLKSKILRIRNNVEVSLAGLTYGRHSADISLDYNNVKRGDGDLVIDENGIAPNEIGIKKLDIFDGMDSIAIRTVDARKIVEDYNRFYDEHSDKVDLGTKKVLDSLKKSFDETTDQNFYDDNKVELAARFLVFEVGFKSKSNDLFYKVLNETDPTNVAKYTKRIKLVTTKNFVRPSDVYLRSVLQARTAITTQGGTDKASELIKKRLNKKSHNIAIWDDGTESISQIVEDLKQEFPDEMQGFSLENLGKAHSDVSGFDSISFLSKDAMMEYHTYLGHNPNSMNPIKPVISSQGEGKTLLYGKTLFVYSPSLEGFFKRNRDVDILLTKSGAKAYDGGDETLITGQRWDDLSNYTIKDKNNLIRKIEIDGLGLRPEKDSNLLSGVESPADYNFYGNRESADAFNEIIVELSDNLNKMKEIMVDPIKMNAFMQQKLMDGDIPSDASEGALGNLSTLMYYLKMNDSADPSDYSLNQVQKYLAKEYIDNVFTNRRTITDRFKTELGGESGRYGGQSYIVQSGTGHLGQGRKTRLLPTLFDKNNKMIMRGQIMLPNAEKETSLSGLPDNKQIRIVQNDRIITRDEFITEIKANEAIQNDGFDVDNLISLFKEDATIGSTHELITALSEVSGVRYELAIAARRNPRTKPNDLTLLGLKGFLDESQGLSVEVNSFDIAHTYEGDYDADKVDYFFAHSNHLFDHINRVQPYSVQGSDPDNYNTKGTFTFQLDAKQSNKAMLSKMGSSIAYKQAIGIAQKTPRKVNYLQNLANRDHLISEDKRSQWDLHIKLNEQTGEYDGPEILYKSGENEFVTIDTKTLAYYHKAATEAQYLLDGVNRLNPNISSNIYDWSDNFLFPSISKSISPKEARNQDVKSIIENGQTPEGKRIRVFQKFTLDADGKYRAINDLNNSDKLVIREFLNQQNKLINAFGDSQYEAGTPRSSTFYDLYLGAKTFRGFHKNLYESLSRQLFYKRKKANLDKEEQNYLDNLLNEDNGAFKSISDRAKEIYDGEGGSYLDRIAVSIAKQDLMDDAKQFEMDSNQMLEMEDWFDDLLQNPSKQQDYNGDDKGNQDSDYVNIDITEGSTTDDYATRVVQDTQDFNKRIATIKRLNKKKQYLYKSSYSPKWKKQKIQAIDWVINKLKEDFEKTFAKDIKKINPDNLKYKEYVHVEESNLKKSVVHANTMHALLKQTPGGFQYDSWFESLPKNAKDDLKTIKNFNQQTYGSNTLIDQILPHGGKSIVTDKKMLQFISEHSTSVANVFELRQKYLMQKVNEHGLKFLYAYMEPTRNRDAIGVFNNRPISIPYKESKRYSHGIQIMASIASGKKQLSNDINMNQTNQQLMDFALRAMIESNVFYNKFFNKDILMRNQTDAQMNRMGLMPFDMNMQNRLKNNLEFGWLNEMLPSNNLSTMNKSVVALYREAAQMLPNKSNDDYTAFVEKLNDIDEYAYKRDYINPLKYMDMRLSLDTDFMNLARKNIYNQEGENGLPENLKNNPMFAHFDAIKFEPKLVKSPAKLVGMLSAVNEVEASLNTAVRQMPMKDSGIEKIRTLKEIQQCQ
jgi:hypothetical protein